MNEGEQIGVALENPPSPDSKADDTNESVLAEEVAVDEEANTREKLEKLWRRIKKRWMGLAVTVFLGALSVTAIREANNSRNTPDPIDNNPTTLNPEVPSLIPRDIENIIASYENSRKFSYAYEGIDVKHVLLFLDGAPRPFYFPPRIDKNGRYIPSLFVDGSAIGAGLIEVIDFLTHDGFALFSDSQLGDLRRQILPGEEIEVYGLPNNMNEEDLAQLINGGFAIVATEGSVRYEGDDDDDPSAYIRKFEISWGGVKKREFAYEVNWPNNAYTDMKGVPLPRLGGDFDPDGERLDDVTRRWREGLESFRDSKTQIYLDETTDEAESTRLTPKEKAMQLIEVKGIEPISYAYDGKNSSKLQEIFAGGGAFYFPGSDETPPLYISGSNAFLVNCLTSPEVGTGTYYDGLLREQLIQKKQIGIYKITGENFTLEEQQEFKTAGIAIEKTGNTQEVYMTTDDQTRATTVVYYQMWVEGNPALLFSFGRSNEEIFPVDNWDLSTQSGDVKDLAPLISKVGGSASDTIKYSPLSPYEGNIEFPRQLTYDMGSSPGIVVFPDGTTIVADGRNASAGVQLLSQPEVLHAVVKEVEKLPEPNLSAVKEILETIGDVDATAYYFSGLENSSGYSYGSSNDTLTPEDFRKIARNSRGLKVTAFEWFESDEWSWAYIMRIMIPESNTQIYLLVKHEKSSGRVNVDTILSVNNSNPNGRGLYAPVGPDLLGDSSLMEVAKNWSSHVIGEMYRQR